MISILSLAFAKLWGQENFTVVTTVKARQYLSVRDSGECEVFRDTLGNLLIERAPMFALLPHRDSIIGKNNLPLSLYFSGVESREDAKLNREDCLLFVTMLYKRLLRNYPQFETVTLMQSYFKNRGPVRTRKTVYHFLPPERYEQEKRICYRKNNRNTMLIIYKPQFRDLE